MKNYGSQVVVVDGPRGDSRTSLEIGEEIT